MTATLGRGRLANAELRALLGCSRAQVTAWEKAGLPFTATKGKGGKPAHSYDRGGALAWVRKNGSKSFAFKAGELLDKARQTPVEGGGKGAKSGGGAGRTGRTGGESEAESDGEKTIVEKLEETLAESYARFLEWNAREKVLLANGQLREAAGCAKARAEAGKAVVQLGEQVTAAAKEMGLLIVAAEAEEVYAKVLTGLRNNVLGVPDSAVPLLMPLLRDADKAEEARQILTRLTEEALREIGKRGGEVGGASA